MNYRRTRSDVKAMREQWKKPYVAILNDIEDKDKKLGDFFEAFRE